MLGIQTPHQGRIGQLAVPVLSGGAAWGLTQRGDVSLPRGLPRRVYMLSTLRSTRLEPRVATRRRRDHDHRRLRRPPPGDADPRSAPRRLSPAACIRADVPRASRTRRREVPTHEQGKAVSESRRIEVYHSPDAGRRPRPGRAARRRGRERCGAVAKRRSITRISRRVPMATGTPAGLSAGLLALLDVPVLAGGRVSRVRNGTASNASDRLRPAPSHARGRQQLEARSPGVSRSPHHG